MTFFAARQIQPDPDIECSGEYEIHRLAGALVIVINYTGDRINFGLAVEKARREGLKVRPELMALVNTKQSSLESLFTV
jgi:dihydroxyacetone kinase